jgi:hypothetical protein
LRLERALSHGTQEGRGNPFPGNITQREHRATIAQGHEVVKISPYVTRGNALTGDFEEGRLPESRRREQHLDLPRHVELLLDLLLLLLFVHEPDAFE